MKVRYILSIIAIALLLSGASLRSHQLTTGLYTCDGAWKQNVWKNDTTQTMRIRKASVWSGASFGSKVDFEGTARKTSDGTLLVTFQWDRYGNPNGIHTLTQDFAPDYVEIPPGDGITLWYRCAKVTGDGVPKASNMFFFWFF